MKDKINFDCITLFNDWLDGKDIKTIKNKYNIDSTLFNQIIDSIFVSYKDILNIHFRNMILDYNKGNNYKLLAVKYNVPVEVCKKVIISLNEYNNGRKLPKNLQEHRRYERKVNTLIRNSINIKKNNKDNLSKQIKNGQAVLATEAYKVGYTESYMRDKFNISSTVSYLCSIDGMISQDKLVDLKDIYIYKSLLSKAYDENIITNDMLNILFKLNDEQADKLKVPYDNTIKSFVSNKLYQIYYTPSLLYNFTFTDDKIEYDALNFINRRYSQELNKIYYSNRNISEVEHLREVYYGTKSNKYIERVKKI